MLKYNIQYRKLGLYTQLGEEIFFLHHIQIILYQARILGTAFALNRKHPFSLRDRYV
jgi:hypothetical protein